MRSQVSENPCARICLRLYHSSSHGTSGSPGKPALRSSLTACLSWLPAENFGTVVAGICTRWDGFLGLTPWRAARRWVVNFPKRRNGLDPASATEAAQQALSRANQSAKVAAVKLLADLELCRQDGCPVCEARKVEAPDVQAKLLALIRTRRRSPEEEAPSDPARGAERPRRAHA
jgi:hypothetical protein